MGTNLDGLLLGVLAGIDRTGDICASADRDLVLPGTEVDGIGTVGLPPPESQPRDLVQLCRQASYGKGTETIVDVNVRRVWEMDPEQFALTSPNWEELIQSILEETKEKLGLQDSTISAHFYKLLLYEKGSIFLPHRDGEKLNGMVATLVVALPSAH